VPSQKLAAARPRLRPNRWCLSRIARRVGANPISSLHAGLGNNRDRQSGRSFLSALRIHHPQPEGMVASAGSRLQVAAIAFAVHGWASFNGNASGKLSALSVNGNLEVYDFDTTLPATARASSRVVHWDALSTSLQYSSSHFAAAMAPSFGITHGAFRRQCRADRHCVSSERFVYLTCGFSQRRRV